MAYPQDDSQATAPAAAPAPPQPAQALGSDVAGQWRDWIQDPQNRASLMQFGISLMQPIGVGQSPMGHLGQALGAGGEAADRVKAQQMAEQKLASETELRGERANLAEQQAGMASQRAGLEGQKLSLQQEMLELKRTLGTSQRAAELQKRFQEAKLLDPKLTLQDFLAQNQQAVKIIQAQEGTGGGTMGAGAGGQTKTINGKNYVKQGGQWYEAG